MRMILVHGINQQGKNAKLIEDNWIEALRKHNVRSAIDPLKRLSRIEATFYGDVLYSESQGKLKDKTVTMGINDESSDFDEFAIEAIKEIANRVGVTQNQIDLQLAETVVPQGAGIHKKSIKAIAILIERLSPFHGALALRAQKQAHAYIRNRDVHEKVNKIVRPIFDDPEPAIIIAHSLGTIVSYSLLREFAKTGSPRQCPLFVTLGSPLGVDSIKKGFSLPRIKPQYVERWINGADPEDLVALRPEITERNFGQCVDRNYSDIENGHDDPHSITKYLSDVRIADEIFKAIV